MSIYENNNEVSFTKSNKYITYFYQNYLDSFLDILQIKNIQKPPLLNYLKIVNSFKKDSLGGILKNILVEKENTEPMVAKEAKKIVDDSISSYLKTLDLSDINFESIQQKLDKDEKGKYYLSYHNNNFTVENIDEHLNLKHTFNINHNTLMLETESGKKINALLRWKNHKGCSGPAWQVSLKL